MLGKQKINYEAPKHNLSLGVQMRLVGAVAPVVVIRVGLPDGVDVVGAGEVEVEDRCAEGLGGFDGESCVFLEVLDDLAVLESASG